MENLKKNEKKKLAKILWNHVPILLRQRISTESGKQPTKSAYLGFSCLSNYNLLSKYKMPLKQESTYYPISL